MKALVKIVFALILVKQIQVRAMVCTDLLTESVSKNIEESLDPFLFDLNLDHMLYSVEDIISGQRFVGYLNQDGVLHINSDMESSANLNALGLSESDLLQSMRTHFRYARIKSILMPMGQSETSLGLPNEELRLEIKKHWGFDKVTQVTDSGVTLFKYSKADIYERGLVRATRNTFIWNDPEKWNFSLTGTLEDNVLEFVIRMEHPTGSFRSSASGHKLMQMMIDHFGTQRIRVIRGNWSEGTNHKQYWDAVTRDDNPLSPEKAALQTWTGKIASSYGYKLARVKDANKLIHGNAVTVDFHKPYWSISKYQEAFWRAWNLDYWGE
jgi:hypothetical protein